MKISDVFNLPVELEFFPNAAEAYDQTRLFAEFGREGHESEIAHESASAVALAINCHDELVEAIDNLLDYFWGACPDTPWEFESRREVVRARAAIKKARGES